VYPFTWNGALQWRNPQIATHDFFRGAPQKDRIFIPMDGVYEILVNIYFSTSNIESEWGVLLNSFSWASAPQMGRIYTGFGAYNGMYWNSIVRLYQSDYIVVYIPRSTDLVNLPYNNHIWLRWLMPITSGVSTTQQ
jgi:hypothetical protein